MGRHLEACAVKTPNVDKVACPTREQITEALKAVIDPELRKDIVELDMVRAIEIKDAGVVDVTAKYREGGRVVKAGRADYLLPTVVHCASPAAASRASSSRAARSPANACAS